MFYTQSVVRRPQSLFYIDRIFDSSKDLTQTPGNRHLMLIMKNAPHITTKAPRIMMTNKAPSIMKKLLHIMTKPPHTTTKAPQIKTKALHMITKAPRVMTKAPHITSKALHIITKVPHIMTKAPHIIRKAVHII